MSIIPLHVQRRFEQRSGCVKRAKGCRNESHAFNGAPRAAKTKEKPAKVK
jgi:hypothetical protein